MKKKKTKVRGRREEVESAMGSFLKKRPDLRKKEEENMGENMSR